MDFRIHYSYALAELRLLLRSINRGEVGNTVLAVELDGNLVVEGSLSIIQSTSLDHYHSLHNIELGVQARAASGAEEMPVVLAGSTSYIVVRGISYFWG